MSLLRTARRIGVLIVLAIASACAPIARPTGTAPSALQTVAPQALAYCRALRGDDKETDGGLGGTGIRGTDVYGTVTALNLLALDGQRLYLPSQAQIASVLGPTDPSALRLGEILLVRAVPARDGLCALSAARFLPIVGQVGEVDVLAGALFVLGTEVTVDSATILESDDGRDLELDDLASGTALAVSGTWDGTRVVASHLRVLSGVESDVASVTGRVRRSANGQMVIGGTPVSPTADMRANQIVAAIGRIQDGVLQVEALRPDLAGSPGIPQRGGHVPVDRILAGTGEGGALASEIAGTRAAFEQAVEQRSAGTAAASASGRQRIFGDEAIRPDPAAPSDARPRGAAATARSLQADRAERSGGAVPSSEGGAVSSRIADAVESRRADDVGATGLSDVGQPRSGAR